MTLSSLSAGPAGAGFALLPLAHCRSGGVQMQREHWLAELQGVAQALDVGRLEFPHRRWTDRVELTHRHLADRARFVQRSQVATQGFNDLAHKVPPVARPGSGQSQAHRRTAPGTPCPRIATPAFLPCDVRLVALGKPVQEYVALADPGRQQGSIAAALARRSGRPAACRDHRPDSHRPSRSPSPEPPCTTRRRLLAACQRAKSLRLKVRVITIPKLYPKRV